jgi:SEC-C motif-containing protein
MNKEQCPCGNERSYKNCCGPIIEGKLSAQTAEELMRSRYTAFTLANGDYLMNSHHADTRNPKDQKSIEKWAKSVNWLKLEVLNATLCAVLKNRYSF